MATWPPDTVASLKALYFDESTRQIGVDETNDFIFGELQNVLRQRLFDKLGAVGGAVPLAALPPSPLLKPGAHPTQLLGLKATSPLSQQDLLNLLKLAAPLAVQAPSTYAGDLTAQSLST